MVTYGPTKLSDEPLFPDRTGMATDRPIATGTAEVTRSRSNLGRSLQGMGIAVGKIKPNRFRICLRPVFPPGFSRHFREDRIDGALGRQLKAGDLRDAGRPFDPPGRSPVGRGCVCREMNQHVVGGIGEKTLQAGGGRFQQLGER